MIAPNSYMLSSEGEAARVYYVMASHAKSDSTYTNFQGMNYPYGEHLVYCDAQPLVTNSFKLAVKVFPDLVDKAVGVQNFISLYALIIGALLLYLFLLRWKVAPWYAAISAYALMLLGPQILRMPWQPSLAYAFFIPLVLLLFQSYIRTRKWNWTIIIFAVNLMSFFVNPYLGMMSSGFFAIVAGILLVTEKWKKIKPYLQSAVQVLLSGVIYQVYVAISDVRIDRIDQPTGLQEFTSSFGSLFTSPHSPATSFYETLGVDMIQVQQHFEGMSYIGLFFNILILFFVGRWIFRLRKKNKPKGLLNKEQKIMLVAAVVFFILALGFPFTYFEGLLDVFKPLKQLRALGRLAWMFTFCLNLVLVFMLYKCLSERVTQKVFRLIGFGVAFLMLSFTAWEGIGLHQQVFGEQVEGNVFTQAGLEKGISGDDLSNALASIDPSDYCALVPIPYFHVGSEQFVTESHTSYRAMLESISFAYHADLPMTACYLSRISREESIKSLQFFAPEMIEKSISADFEDKRPLLLFFSKSKPPTSEGEKRLLKLGEVVFESANIQLVELPQELIWQTNESKIFSWLNEYKSNYTESDNVFYFGDEPPVHLSFDSKVSKTALNGGAFAYSINSDEYFFDQKKDAPELKSGVYDLSFWLETSKNRNQAKLILEKYDSNGTLISEEEIQSAKRSFAYWENWLRWNYEIEIQDGYSIKLRLEQPSNTPGLFIDELMLLPKNSSVFVRCNEKIWLWNNYILDMR